MSTKAKNSTSPNNSRSVQHLISRILVSGIIVLSILGCEQDNAITDLQTNTPIFDLDLFEQNIIDYINAGGDTPVGWAYTISKDGNLSRSNAFGKARTAADGTLNFTPQKEINVASVSKFYTAIAAMQLLEANNLTIEDKINTWLPDTWVKGPGVSELTFKDLLKHESGLQSTNTNFDTTLGYEGLQNCIQTGVVNSTTRNYLNVNFALFRVLIPSLWSNLEGSPAIDIENDANTQFMYLLYMQQHVFDPLSLPLVGCVPEDRETATLYYNVNNPNNGGNGQYYGSWNNKSGGGGYFMTTMEMAKVNAYFEHTEVLVSNEQKAIMKLHRLGMDTADPIDEIHGNYYSKAGSIGTSNDPTTSQGVQTQIVMFPFNGIDCVVVMNSQGVTLQGTISLRQMIYNAYNNAWVQP
ncbi:serine hydrolase domain-containing protein [Aquimarina brevivitae]|uniref:CubicO group peptidase (Beta-lactamase class C family) n=1 Tax=Aquimarina brevivitae TaxID=323412 RepID=A0A4Q7PES8_9FLAO|nr:serine hydrolase [Aquimarina brevivitae]RZS98936.1 CubicO group peptidase (beta-lactamase class C family) [Aquimarina brevivitae]